VHHQSVQPLREKLQRLKRNWIVDEIPMAVVFAGWNFLPLRIIQNIIQMKATLIGRIDLGVRDIRSVFYDFVALVPVHSSNAFYSHDSHYPNFIHIYFVVHHIKSRPTRGHFTFIAA
jgi:hypothetical protein